MHNGMIRRCAALGVCGAIVVSLCTSAFGEELNAQNPEKTQGKIVNMPPQTANVAPWAKKEVYAAYQNQLVPIDFALGENYAAGITRAQFARLAVELVAVGNGTDTASLFVQYNVAVPPEDADLKKAGTSSVNEKIPNQTRSSFVDTDDVYIELAAKMNIVKGKGNGLFVPEGVLSRGEAAVMLQRCMNLMGCPDANAAPKTFSDGYTIPRWAREAVKYISGRTTADGRAVMGGVRGAFAEKGAYTIEQAIVTVLRCYESKEVQAVYPNWKNAPGYDTVDITMTFGGDCTFGRSRTAGYKGSFDEMYDKMGAAYFFSNVKEFRTDDLTMVNFEGALTTYDVPREEKAFLFRGRSEYAGILKAGSVEVVTVANNHARDYGDRGLKDTMKNLSSYVAVSGFGQMPIVEIKGVKIGFASNLGWYFNSAQKQFINHAIQDLRARGANIIVFNFHWGEEGEYQSNATQRAIGRYCIDQGADLVIGHHPHVVQEVETYKGKQIVYSLGNLCFGGNRNPSDKNCLVFQQTFTMNVDNGRVKEKNHKAIPYKISSVKYKNDYRPTAA